MQRFLRSRVIVAQGIATLPTILTCMLAKIEGDAVQRALQLAGVLAGAGVIPTAWQRDRFLVDVVSAVALSPYLCQWMLTRAGYSVSGPVSGSKSIIC